MEQLQMELKKWEIKSGFLENEKKVDSLVSWVSLQTGSERYSVAECYDRVWDELIDVAIRRRESNAEKQGFKLLDWLKEKEDLGRKWKC